MFSPELLVILPHTWIGLYYVYCNWLAGGVIRSGRKQIPECRVAVINLWKTP